MNKSQALTSIAILSFVSGAGFTVIERYNYRQDNLARLRSNPDLVEIKPGIFCIKSAADELPDGQLMRDGFCNTRFSKATLL